MAAARHAADALISGLSSEGLFEHLDRSSQRLVTVEIARAFSGTARQLLTAFRTDRSSDTAFSENVRLVDRC